MAMALTESDPPRKLLEASQKLHEENKRLQLEIARLKEDKIDILGEIEDEKKTLFKHCDDKENEIKSAKKEIDDLKRYIDEAHANYLKKDKELSDLSILYNSMKSEKENMEKTLLTSTAVSATSSDIFVANSVLPSSTAISTYTMANVKNINNENKTAVTMTSSAASVPLSSITGLGAVASSAVPSLSGRLINEAIATQNSALIGNSTYGVKLPTYKSPGDIETFISRFEQYCITQNVEEIRKANLLLTALDDATFTVVKRELTDDERKNYNTIKKHLEKRFDLLKDAGQKRLIFRQARREHGQTIEEFYTQLLGMAAKAFPGESSQAVDRMILDQLICGCADEKIRFHLIEKAPATSRDALSLAVAYQAAIKYNESLKDNILISTIQGENNQENYSNETRGRNIRYSQSTRNDENFRGRDSDYHDQYNRNYSAERGRDRRNEYFNRGQHEDRIIKGRNFLPRNIFSESGQERRLRSQERVNYAFNNGNIFRGNINGNLRPEYGGNFRNDRIQENYRNQPRTNRTISTERQNATQRLVRFNRDRAGYANILSSPTHLFYVNGMFGNEILAILIDSGSAATIIDEEIWKNIKGERDVLEKVPFSIRSATKHELEILGQKTISFSLLYRNHKGSKEFRTNVIVVKGLTHKAILGLDFLKQYAANMDIWNKKLILYTQGVKSVHQLMEKRMEMRSIQIVISETIELLPRTQTRLDFKIGDEVKDGVEIYFEPSNEIETLPIAVAGTVDVIHEGNITTQFINPTFEKFLLKPGTVIGQIEIIPDTSKHKPVYLRKQTVSKESDEWIQKMDIGEENYNQIEIGRIKDLLKEYKDVFSQNEYDLGRSDLVPHTIEIIGEKPRRSGVRPLNPSLRNEVEKQLKILQENDMIEPSKSEYACPVVMVRKKDGTYRFCCDFRKINAVTRRDVYPLPRIDEILSTLTGAKIFSLVDMKSGYFQCSVAPEDKYKTAFTTQFGLFQWKVMPMGMCNSSSTFQRLMDLLMAGLTWHGVLIYIDDLLIYGNSFDQHFDRFKEVLSRLREANLKLAPKKCHLLKREITYLGHQIVDGVVKPDPTKTKIIDEYPVPTSIKEVKSYVSLMSYYRKFVPGFAQIAKPLTTLLEKNAEFKWSVECQLAFEKLKSSLSKETSLYLANFDLPFRLACDASGVAIGAVLSQIVDKKERPIAFFSKVLTKQQRNWSVTERELYAVVMGCQTYRQYLLGRHFEIITDHRPLVWMRNLKNPSAKVFRWLLQLEEYTFTVIYKEGKRNQNVDVMSRLAGEAVVETMEMVELDSSLTKEEILLAQQEDETVKKIVELLKDSNAIFPTTGTMKGFSDKKDELFIDGGLLYRQISDEHCQVILPPMLHTKILEILHDNPTAGHLGIDKTDARFLEAFYWPNMKKIIARYIKQCEKCEMFKTPKENSTAPLQPIVSQRILELLVIDFIGPLPVSKKGNKYILSMIDHFSKYAAAFPTSRQDTPTVIACLNQFFARFGPVEKILSDNGRSFVSKEFIDFCKTWSIKKSTSTAYHAQTQGLCEKWNSTIIQILKRYVLGAPDTWDDNLEIATFAYNTAVQRTNGVTPYEVMFGRKANTSISHIQEKPNMSESDYLTKLKRDITRMHKIIIENQTLARDREKQIYDKKSGKNFEIGEQVLLFNPVVKLGESKKFTPHYKGPYEIEAKQGETNYVLKPLKKGLRPETVHQNRLKRSFINLEKEVGSKQIEKPEEQERKRKELIKFIQPTERKADTTTETDDDWWLEPLTNTKQIIKLPEEKTEIDKLMKDNRKLSLINKTFITEKYVPVNKYDDSKLEKEKEHNKEPIIHTPTIKNSRASSHEPSPIEFVTPQMNNEEIRNSRKIEKEIVESTPINEEILNSPGGQNEIDKQTNYEKEIRQLLDFSETGETSFKTIKDQMEATANLSDCNEESDNEQDADTESLYEPNREITPPLPRRNPERQRKKPERYGIYEINNITETQPNIYKGRGNYHGFGHWQLSLLMMCCLFIPFGSASSEQTTIKERIRSEPIMQSLWQKVMIAVCTFFSSETGYLLGVILGYAIGISILAGVIIYLMHLNRNNARISQLLILLAIITLGKTEIISTNNNLGVLFGPAHICGGSGHHSLYMELPDEIECIWTDPREPLLENVVVTTYFPKTFSNKISAYGCTVEIKSITTSMGFWGTKSILDKSLVYRKLDYEDCLKEVRHLKNKERNLVEIGHETWTNDSAPFEAKFTWLTTNKQERYRIILKEIEIKFNFNTGKVVSPDFQLHNCVMNSSYCEQSEVTILWQTTEKSYCNLQEGKTVIAQRMRDNQRRGWMMTSDAGQFTLTGPLSTKLMCGIPDIYTSDQGVFVKVRNVTFSQTLAEKIRSQIGKAEGPTTTYTGLINYVAHQLQNMMVELFKKNYLNICRLNQERIIYLHHLASQPSTAYLASRMLMKSQSVMGYSSGQLITTYQCDIVEEYYQQPTDQCYNTIPITYKNQEKNFTRYLLPASMDLLPLDSPIPCNKPTAVFIKSIKQHEAEERQSRLIYRWNGSILSTEPNLQYRHATMIEQLGNITDLHLMSSTIYDASHEEVDTLMELTMASNLLVSMANSLHLGSTGLDSHMLLHGANATLTVMKATINRVIDTTYPFIKWIGKLIKFSIITLLVITIIIISVKLWKWLKTKQRKQETRQTRNDIVRFLTSLQQDQEDNQRTTEENNSNVRD